MNELLHSIPDLLKDVLSGMPHFMSEIVLTVTFITVILAGLFSRGRQSLLAFWLCLAGIAISLVFVAWQGGTGNMPVVLFGKLLIADSLSTFLKVISAAVIILFAVFVRTSPRIQSHSKGAGDLYMLLPGILLGLNLMTMSASLLMIYISVEMISISSYILVGYVSDDSKQTEAAMKYVLFGSACSAIMLYGMSLLYSFTGTLNLYDTAFAERLSQVPPAVSGIAIVLVLVGIGFKLSFVPLHFWSPDVYEGAPVAVTAFLSTGPKIAAFAILVRFAGAFNSTPGIGVNQIFDFVSVLSGVAILSMIIGNFVAIWQNNIKRMLAYSSIGHTGFIMMAVIVNSDSGLKAMLFYLLIYGIMNMAAFMIAGKIEDQSGAVTVNDYKGLGRILKTEMICFVIVLMSLTGLPPLAGFIGKFLLFSAVFEGYAAGHSGWLLALLITGAITTVVSLFYYFKIPLNAFLRQAETRLVINRKKDALFYIILVLTFFLILWGVFPGGVSGRL